MSHLFGARNAQGELDSRLGLYRLVLLLLFDLEEKRAVDVRQDTSEGNGGTNQGIELLVTADGQLEMTGRNALDLEVLRGVLEGVASTFASQVVGFVTRY